MEGESGTALALITDSELLPNLCRPTVSVTGTNGLLRYLLENGEDGWLDFPTIRRTDGDRKSLQDRTTRATSVKRDACELSDAEAGPFAGGQEHVEDNRIVDRDLMRPKSFTRRDWFVRGGFDGKQTRSAGRCPPGGSGC